MVCGTCSCRKLHSPPRSRGLCLLKLLLLSSPIPLGFEDPPNTWAHQPLPARCPLVPSITAKGQLSAQQGLHTSTHKINPVESLSSPHPYRNPPKPPAVGYTALSQPSSQEQHSGSGPCESEFPIQFLWASLGCSDELILSALRGTEGPAKF